MPQENSPIRAANILKSRKIRQIQVNLNDSNQSSVIAEQFMVVKSPTLNALYFLRDDSGRKLQLFGTRNKENPKQSATRRVISPEREQYQAGLILVFAAFKNLSDGLNSVKPILNPPHHFRAHQYIFKPPEWPTRWKTPM